MNTIKRLTVLVVLASWAVGSCAEERGVSQGHVTAHLESPFGLSPSDTHPTPSERRIPVSKKKSKHGGAGHDGRRLPPQCNDGGRCVLSVRVPAGARVADFAVLSAGGILARSGVEVRGGLELHGSVASTGGSVTLERNDSTGSIVASKRVFVGHGSTVHGSITSAATVRVASTAAVLGEIEEHEPLEVEEEILLTLVAAGPSQGSLHVGRRPRSLGAGQFRHVLVDRRGKLRLRDGGEYVMDVLQLQHGAELRISNNEAPVDLHVMKNFVCDGDIALDSPRPNVRIIYWGSSAIDLRCDMPLITLIAPNASVRVAKRVTVGSVIAKRVTLDKRAVIDGSKFRELTTGQDPDLNLNDADDATLSQICQSVQAFSEDGLQHIGCMVRARGAAIGVIPPNADEDMDALNEALDTTTLRLVCNEELAACLAEDPCTETWEHSCDATVGEIEECLDAYVPEVLSSLSGLPGCNQLNALRVIVSGQSPTLSASCAGLVARCPMFGR